MKLTRVPLRVFGSSTYLSYFLRTNISFFHDTYIINSKNVNSEWELVHSEALKLLTISESFVFFELFRFVQNRFLVSLLSTWYIFFAHTRGPNIKLKSYSDTWLLRLLLLCAVSIRFG